MLLFIFTPSISVFANIIAHFEIIQIEEKDLAEVIQVLTVEILHQTLNLFAYPMQFGILVTLKTFKNFCANICKNILIT